MEAMVYPTRQQVISSCLYYVIFFNISLLSVICLILSFYIFFLYAPENPALEDHSIKSSTNQPTPIYPKEKLPLLEEKSPTPQHFSKLVNKNKIINLNIASYFLNILASPDE